MDATITLREYLGKKKDFVIPEYQRGYIWTKKRIEPKNQTQACHFFYQRH